MASPRFLAFTVTFLLGTVSLTVAASASDGVALRSGTLRSGPGVDYPAVDHISHGDELHIFGCVTDYSWCDVSNDESRGWFPGSRIGFDENGDTVVLSDDGPSLGIGIIGYDAGIYWDTYYRGRPFYRQRQRWVAYGNVHSRYRGPVISPLVGSARGRNPPPPPTNYQRPYIAPQGNNRGPGVTPNYVRPVPPPVATVHNPPPVHNWHPPVNTAPVRTHNPPPPANHSAPPANAPRRGAPPWLPDDANQHHK